MTPREAPLWTAPELAAAVRGRAAASVGPESIGDVKGVSIDSRTLAPGDLFVALDGLNRDGHEFVATALANGAAAALVSRVPDGLPADAPLILVDDTQAALEELGRAARDRTTARVAAITGSVGKTGTKEMIALALSAQGSTHWSVGSYNNLWGVPLSLARMRRETDFGVFEIGMNHAGEITPLVRQVAPHVAIITNVEPVHLEFFDGIEGIADAKAEIFAGLDPDGIAILNRDNPMFARLEASAAARGIGRIITFGRHTEASARLIDVALGPDESRIEARIGPHHLVYRLSQPGLHLVLNSLAVLAAIEGLGADIAQAAQALENFAGVTGRGKRHPIAVLGGSALLIDESYNASPASVRAALSVLASSEPESGRRIAVLGDMRELGAAGPDLHRALAEPIAEADLDLVFASGKLMHRLFDVLPEAQRGAWAESAADLLPIVAAALVPGDIVMVKGSLGSRMADIVQPLIAGAADQAPEGTEDPSC